VCARRGYSLKEETEMRKEMARAMRQYMILKGLPRFLSQREETKALGQAYQSTVATCEQSHFH